MYKRSVGIEIADRQVKAVKVVSSWRKNRLVNVGVIKIDYKDADEGVVNAVRTVLTNMNIDPCTKVNISLPGREVDMQSINRPHLRLTKESASPNKQHYQNNTPEEGAGSYTKTNVPGSATPIPQPTWGRPPKQ